MHNYFNTVFMYFLLQAVHSIANPEKQTKALDSWIDSIRYSHSDSQNYFSCCFVSRLTVIQHQVQGLGQPSITLAVVL